MKKRYVLTLTKENMEGLQQLLRDMGYKPESGVISDMVDEFIEGQLKYGLPAARSGRKPTALDSFRFLIDKITEVSQDDNKIDTLADTVSGLQRSLKEAKKRANNAPE